MSFDPAYDGQLDLFVVSDPEIVPPGAYDDPDERRVYQLAELPGESFEDIFGDAA